MTRALLALAVLACVAAPAAAVAQVPTLHPLHSLNVDSHRYQADRHRYEIDRLRAQADHRAAFARQMELDSRLRRLEVEAARQPDLAPLPAAYGYRALRSPEEERALRLSATERRVTVERGVTQIDAWLDRPAD